MSVIDKNLTLKENDLINLIEEKNKLIKKMQDQVQLENEWNTYLEEIYSKIIKERD